MTRVLQIARNTFRGVMSQRALYIWALALVLMLLRSVPALSPQGRSPEVMLFVRAMTVSNTLDIWAVLSTAAAVFLGAAAVSSDIRSKVLMTVLARPIRRWELLTGKWLGLVAFCVVTLVLGVALAAGLAAYLGITVEREVLAIAMTRTVAGIMLFGAVAVALSALSTTAIAASLTVLLAFSAPLVRMLLDEPGRVQHAIGVTLDYLTPPPQESHYNGVAWAPRPVPPAYRGPRPVQQAPTIDYAAQRQRAAVTVGYGAVYFLIGCALFSRRDIRIS